jgi:hypothetical protein
MLRYTQRMFWRGTTQTLLTEENALTEQSIPTQRLSLRGTKQTLLTNENASPYSVSLALTKGGALTKRGIPTQRLFLRGTKQTLLTEELAKLTEERTYIQYSFTPIGGEKAMCQ